MLFADVRGSTAIAEHMPPSDFSRLLARFYGELAVLIVVLILAYSGGGSSGGGY